MILNRTWIYYAYDAACHCLVEHRILVEQNWALAHWSQDGLWLTLDSRWLGHRTLGKRRRVSFDISLASTVWLHMRELVMLDRIQRRSHCRLVQQPQLVVICCTWLFYDVSCVLPGLKLPHSEFCIEHLLSPPSINKRTLYDHVDLAQAMIILFLPGRMSIRYHRSLSFHHLIHARAPLIPADFLPRILRSCFHHRESVLCGELFRVKSASILHLIILKHKRD